jgi:small subunit ribosomal protein S7
MTDEKVAAAEPASEKSAKPVVAEAKASKEKKDAPKKDAPKKEKKYVNPFNESDPLQAKMVNCIMKQGKKTIARRILRDTFDEMNRKGEKDVLGTFEKAIQKSTPTMEVRPRRVGGSIYQIPLEVNPKRQASLPIRWILQGARNKKGQPMYKRLATELMDCANEQGFGFNKREDVHKMAQANKAFAHLARY